MAGNIVKWWKHKILGGYKQFSVQECTTDSEELMYHQVRASSSCSAPPDLLLVSDRENNIPLRSPVVHITTTTTSAAAHASGSSQKQQQQQHQPHHQQTSQQLQNSTKDATGKHTKNNKNSNKLVNIHASTPNPALTQQDEVDGAQQPQHQRHSHASHSKDERIRLEEFTCDVSVEGGKSTQPLQFSFTFYDLDGHHGKITKDDIVGIVYTIYESIGKSVVVPHCGSKTINVRLTVSPEGKSKTSGSKLKKMPTNVGSGNGSAAMGVLSHANGKMHGLATTAAGSGHVHGYGHGHGHGHTRRQHRYRPRKLIKSDDEDDDSNSEKEKELATVAAASGVKSKSSKYNKSKMEQLQQQCCQQQQQENIEQNLDISTSANNCQLDNLYENMTANLKCCAKDGALAAEDCGGCVVVATTAASSNANGHARLTTDMYMKQASTRVKMLRKARKQKYQDHCHETRQRSLSLGSESCWKNRLPMQQIQQIQITAKTAQTAQSTEQHGDVVDGVQLRNPQKNPAMLAATKRNSAECWKTALNRNDLISIIRESMEKNRLCFQLNGKPQANVSPIRQPQHHQHTQQQQHRQRSNTVSKIPTLISNHNNSIINHTHNNTFNNNANNSNSNSTSNNNNNNNNNNQHQHHHSNNYDLSMHDNSNSSLYHPQPHIPIYHQQMAINPAVLAAQNNVGHSKMNLCGYDSFLHATICGGGTSHSPPPPPATTQTIAATTTNAKMISNQPTIQQYHQQQQQQQPIATVQPLISAVPSFPNSTPKMFTNSSTTNQIKTSKILRSGSCSQTQHTTAQNSPQYHGYQRLTTNAQHQQQQLTATKNNLAALNLQYPSVERSQMEHLAKWLHVREKCHKSKKDAKNYDNLLYAKLSEKLQDSSLNANYANKENLQRRKHKLQRRQANLASAHSAANSSKSQSTGSSSANEKVADKTAYITMIPINGDPIECENLLGQTTDEETSNDLLTPCIDTAKVLTTNEKFAETKPHVATGTLVDLNDDAETTAQLQVNADDVEVCGDEEVLEEEEEETESGGSTSPTNVAIATTSNAANTSTSSLIHRYVHEHIHHHYHHFEDKDE